MYDRQGLLRPEVFDVCRQVDHILHGGDVGKWEVMIDLQAIAPVTAVYGNVAPPEIRSRLPQVATAELDGFAVVVTHGDQFGHPTPDTLHAAFPQAEIIVYGHTHKPLLELMDRTVTVMNPGGAGHPRFGLRPSVGIMELEAGDSPRGRPEPPPPVPDTRAELEDTPLETRSKPNSSSRL